MTSNGQPIKIAKHLALTLQHFIQSANPFSGLKIHSHVLKTGYVANTNILIKTLILYLKTGCLRYARQVFDEMPTPTISAYNYLIAGYLRGGEVEASLRLVGQMARSGESPDAFTFSMVLKALTNSFRTSLPTRHVDRAVHGRIVRSGIEVDYVLSTALVDCYVKRGRMLYARMVFDCTAQEDAACATSIISGYMNQGHVSAAEEIFSRIESKDIVVFNAMIEGYSKWVDNSEKALNIFSQMQELGFTPNLSTFSSVIGACSVIGDILVNQQLHCQLSKREFSTSVKMGSALIDMYSKCGRTSDARRVFDEMGERNVFTWTSIIDGYGRNGKAGEAVELLKMMKESGMAPNSVTFLGALGACAHGGLVSEGRELFESMKREYSMKPQMEHYACMVDLMGRAGLVKEAWIFVKEMPTRPSSDVWNALLSACNVHGEVEMARTVASEIFKLNGEKITAAYVSISNTYASAGKWEYVDSAREVMHSRKPRKFVGCSWS